MSSRLALMYAMGQGTAVQCLEPSGCHNKMYRSPHLLRRHYNNVHKHIEFPSIAASRSLDEAAPAAAAVAAIVPEPVGADVGAAADPEMEIMEYGFFGADESPPSPSVHSRTASPSNQSVEMEDVEYRPAVAYDPSIHEFDIIEAIPVDEQDPDADVPWALDADEEFAPPPPPPAEPAPFVHVRPNSMSAIQWLLHFLPAWASRNQTTASSVTELFVALRRTFEMILEGYNEQHLKDEFQRDVKNFPSNLHGANKTLAIDVNSFKRYAFCSDDECGAIYSPKQIDGGLIRCTRFVHVSCEQPAAQRTERTAELEVLERKLADGTWKEVYPKASHDAVKKATQRCLSVLVRADTRIKHGLTSGERKEAEKAAAAAAQHHIVEHEDEHEEDVSEASSQAAEEPEEEKESMSARYPGRPRRQASVAVNMSAAGAGPASAAAREKVDLQKYTKNPLFLCPYRGVIEPLKKLCQHNGFVASLDDHRKRMPYEGEDRLYSDVWDGAMWRDFQHLNSRTQRPWKEADVAEGDQKQEFLAASGTIAFALNVDWWQTSKQQNYSMGGVYLTVLNLPRETRYLKQNMMLIALLPGPGGSHRQALQSLQALIAEELLLLFEGVWMETPDRPAGGQLIRGFLMSIICDEPAARQSAGVLSHAARINCAYCLDCHVNKNALSYTKLPGEWTLRTEDRRRVNVKTWTDVEWTVLLSGLQGRSRTSAIADDEPSAKRAKPAAAPAAAAPAVRRKRRAIEVEDEQEEDEQEEEEEEEEEDEEEQEEGEKRKEARKVNKNTKTYCEQQNGDRYSAWCALPYFDHVRGTPIDVMHNIYLGMVKELTSLLCREMPPENSKTLSLVLQDKLNQERAKPPKGGVPAFRIAEFEKGIHLLENAAKPLSILSKKHLIHLQSFMTRCSCPSDIGRIPGKIASSWNEFKASEWTNWMCIFCVPAMRELMHLDPPAARPVLLLEDHLTLLATMQKVAVTLQKYVIRESEIRVVEGHLLTILKETERLFGAQAIKPNMHQSQHLGQMLRDYGPPAGWWCNSYERYNGLLAAVPRNPAFMEICTMRRAILLIEIIGIIHSEALQVRENILGRPTTRDFQMILHMVTGVTTPMTQIENAVESVEELQQSIRVTSSGRKQHIYSITGDWSKTYTKFSDMRTNIETVNTTIGCEPYPGGLRNARKLKKAHLGVIGLQLNPFPLEEFMSADRIMGIMRYLFGLAYVEHHLVGSTAAERNALLAGPEEILQARLREANLYVPDSFELFDTLDLAGDTYGSKYSTRSHRNSFVRVQGVHPHGGNLEVWYGQVQFYCRFHFFGRDHDFVVMKYFAEIEVRKLKWTEKVRQTYKEFPIVTTLPTQWSRQDIVPVVRIIGRWIPCATFKTPVDTSNTRYWQVCPIATREHA